MGKKKTIIIDDSQPLVEEKKDTRKKVNPNPELEEVVVRKKVNPNPELEEKATPASTDPDQPELETTESAATPKADKKTKKPKTGKKYRSKKYLAKVDETDSTVEELLKRNRDEDQAENTEVDYREQTFSVPQAIDLAKGTSYSKFEGTIELHITTNSKNIRGLASLPFASGKSLKVIAFGKGAEESGADLIGDDEALASIEKGKINFDVLVTTPALMPKLARAAKVLGPRGLMPNPKNGTISDDLKKAVEEIQSGKVEYKTERNAPVIHLGIGKVAQPTEEITQNIKILLNNIGKTKIKKAVVSPSMGLGIKIDLATI